jgi:hypothetical protein
MNPNEREILNGVIIGFRNLINERYQYENITSKYEIPDSFDEESVARFRTYFLEQIYPHLEKRDELNEAFKSLDNYITHPDKLLRILFDSTAILFKHGRQVPKLLNAGMKAFRSFRVATAFEQSLVRKARISGKAPPYSNDDINGFIKELPRREIDRFIENTRSLLGLLYDRGLMREIIEIISQLITRMKKSQRSYSTTEIGGLEIGLEMLTEGNKLFDELSKEDQLKMFDIIIQIEVDVLETLFAKE